MSYRSAPHLQDRTRRAIESEASRTFSAAVSPHPATAPATQCARWSSSSPSATDCSALVAADTWVRMSMQYLSSPTIRCSPRTWPSIRRSRRRWSCLLSVYPCISPPEPSFFSLQHNTPLPYSNLDDDQVGLGAGHAADL